MNFKCDDCGYEYNMPDRCPMCELMGSLTIKVPDKWDKYISNVKNN